MPRCPVCRSRYKREDERCSTCGWNLQPYSLVIGLIPEVGQKEQANLAWAKDLWGVLMRHREHTTQLQQQLKAVSESETQLQRQLTEALQARDSLSQAFQQQQAKFEHLQAEFEHLQAEFEQLKQSQPAQIQPTQQAAPLLSSMVSTAPEQTPNQVPAPSPEQPSSHLSDQETELLSDSEIEQKVVLELVQKPVQKLVAKPIQKQAFQFQVVTLDRQRRINYQSRSATGFLETLGLDVALEMVEIPGGQFWMGSPEAEAGREASETAQHRVSIASFWMGRFPITQRQWRVLAELPSIDRPLNPDPSAFKGDQHPVEQVSWYDAIEFCARLSQLTGRSYRLPSEAEWEYACRAGTTTPFHFGPTISSDWANYDGSYTYDTGVEGVYRQQTTPVGSFQVANAFGLADMHGNVWEWCADLWHENYHGAPTDGRAWLEAGIENQRVLRGGAWYCLPTLCRSAHRHWDQADHAGSGISFRVVCSLDSSFG